MIQKSASKYYAPHTKSRWSHFKFLSSKENKNEVYYEYPEPTEHAVSTHPGAGEGNKGDAVSVTLKVEVKNSASKVLEAQLGEVAPVATSEGAVVDASLSAAHVVLAITAQKLKRAFDQVPTQKTIRELSGGTYEARCPRKSS